jgi:hypothetical protein
MRVVKRVRDREHDDVLIVKALSFCDNFRSGFSRSDRDAGSATLALLISAGGAALVWLLVSTRCAI